MNSDLKKQFDIIKESLEITKAVSIRFSDNKSDLYKKFQDTACTALARALKYSKSTFIDREKGQLCSGGNYFLGIEECSDREVCDVYVKDECVFKDDKICLDFLEKLPKYPKKLEKKYILFTPLDEEEKEPDIIVLLANPAQVGRILGLGVFDKFQFPYVLPSAPSCLSLYSPAVNNKIHLNFIDYYDRYYQGKQEDKFIWDENEMLISFTYEMFENIVKNIPNSAQGSFRTDLKPQKIDSLE